MVEMSIIIKLAAHLVANIDAMHLAIRDMDEAEQIFKEER